MTSISTKVKKRSQLAGIGDGWHKHVGPWTRQRGNKLFRRWRKNEARDSREA